MSEPAETAEDVLAQRIEQLRTDAGWSYAEMSRRMEEAGCPIERSSLQKIEKGSPRRKIGVNELLAFTIVFGKTFSELLLSPKEMSRLTFKQDVNDIGSVSRAKWHADEKYDALVERLVSACLEPDEGAERLRELTTTRAYIEREQDPADSIMYPLLVTVTDRVRDQLGEDD